MSYSINREGLFEDHTNTKLIKVAGSPEEVVSYLNQLHKQDVEHLELLDKLLMASLSSVNLNRVQDEVAKVLRFPGIEGYIREKFKTKTTYILGVSSYGGFEEVSRTNNKEEADNWISKSSDQENTMNVCKVLNG